MSELLHVTHATLVFLILAMMVILIILSVVYIQHDYYLKKKQKKPKWLSGVPSLETMHRYIVAFYYASFVILTLVILNGLALAHSRWDHNWIAQPKFILAQSTWVYFLIMLIIRKTKGLRGVSFLIWLLVGCLLVCLSMLGAYVWK